MPKGKPCITGVTPAGDGIHGVVTVVNGKSQHQHKPCIGCPWRKENVGNFPSGAFRISANTSYDMAGHTFACHMRGADNPSTCAGFLLSKSADDNMSVRIERSKRQGLEEVDGDGCDLFDTYRKMAIANGVAPNDGTLRGCMPEARDRFYRRKRNR